MKLKFVWDTPERIFWIVSNLLIIVFCIFTGIIAETWYLSALFFLFGAAFFVFLMINDVINRKVFIEENVLTIKLLWIKKQIQLDKVLWYTKNNIFEKNLFCKSNKNICLFYETKKEYVSVKEIEYIENILIQNGIPQAEKEEIENPAPHKISPVLLYIMFINGTNIYLRTLDSPHKKLIQYLVIPFFILMIFLCFIELRRFYLKKNNLEKKVMG